MKEQIDLLVQKTDFFVERGLLAPVNIDGPTSIVLRQQPRILRQTEDLPWLRFEPVEHIRLSKDSAFTSIYEFGPLWPGDFGIGMVGFSALSEMHYNYTKITRELLVMLRQSPKGHTLFFQLLHLMDHYCREVIVKDVETPEEWCDVQNSSAFAA